ATPMTRDGLTARGRSGDDTGRGYPAPPGGGQPARARRGPWYGPEAPRGRRSRWSLFERVGGQEGRGEGARSGKRANGKGGRGVPSPRGTDAPRLRGR